MLRRMMYTGVILGMAILAVSCGKKEGATEPKEPSGAQETTTTKEAPVNTNPQAGKTTDLLAADMSNVNYDPAGWKYEDGVLTWLESKGNVWTKEQYGDFTLELDWKISEGGNSGVIFRCTDPEDWLYTGLELQIHEDGDSSSHGQCGAIYDLASPVGYQNAALVVKKGSQTWSVPPVRGNTLELDARTTLSITKVYDNLKFLERQGKQMPYDAPAKDESNPAILVKITPAGGQAKDQFVYADATKNEAGQYDCSYQLGHWIADKDVRKPAGQWNHYKLTVTGPDILVEMNGILIVHINLDDYMQAGRNPQGTLNKYSKPVKEMARKGYIALQDHGHAVWFRNIRITPLN
ncbi:MAG: DUF1080 domain-containing protein [Sedimentisphaerales bacterium]|nr:DUF1080 domain-containing protein [Sedimentisphaerales bacterium]